MAKMVNPHKVLSPEWYEWMHNNVLQVHEHFMALIMERWPKTTSVLEVGCGKYDAYHKFFHRINYTGIDKDEGAYLYCRDTHKNILGHRWFCEDIHGFSGIFSQLRHSQADLVFSHAVIDHSFCPDCFIRKSIEASKKYTYIMSYRGYFDGIAEHKIEKNSRDGYYYNDISIPQVRRLLDGLGHKYELREVPTGLPAIEIQSELHIIVQK